MPIAQLTILGVGLLGGSVGLAAKAHGAALRIRGVGRDERNLARALSSGAIDSFSTDVTEAVADADIVVICTPVDRIADDVLAVANAAPARCLITDVGSTKGNILAALAGKLSATGPTFVPAHPLAGSEKRAARMPVPICSTTVSSSRRRRRKPMAKRLRPWNTFGVNSAPGYCG